MTTFFALLGLAAAAALLLLGLLAAYLFLAALYGDWKTQRTLERRVQPVADALAAGREPDAELLAALAHDPATRATLLDALLSADRDDLFPPEHRTTEALALSDMVRWLLHPGELGRVPDRIERIRTVEKDLDGRAVKFFIYRFRTDAPHWAAPYGWMAGVAGPYGERDRADGVTGRVFSEYEPLRDDDDPERHLARVERVLCADAGGDVGDPPRPARARARLGERLKGDLPSGGWMYAKAALLALAALGGGILVLIEPRRDLRLLFLLVCVWGSCRFYYFLFHALERYAGGERYAGLFDLIVRSRGRRGR